MPRSKVKKVVMIDPAITKGRRLVKGGQVKDEKGVLERVQETVYGEKVNAVMQQMFGKLNTVEPDVLEYKRRLLRNLLGSLAKALQEIMSITAKELPEDVPASFNNTLDWVSFIKEREEFINLHPHKWLVQPFFERVKKLKQWMLDINKATDGSIGGRNKELFLKWSNPVKHILPVEKDEPFNFNLVPSVLPEVFQRLMVIEIATTTSINEMIHPPYNWQPHLELSIAKLKEKAKAALATKEETAMGDGIESMQPEFVRQLPAMYMKRIGVTNEGIDWTSFLTRASQLNEKTAAGISKETEDILSGKTAPEVQQLAHGVFGKSTIEELLRGKHEEDSDEGAPA